MLAVLVLSGALFGWSFYQLQNRLTANAGTTCDASQVPIPLIYANGDYCAWPLWPNTIIRLASSGLALFLALISFIVVAKEVRPILLVCTTLFIIAAIVFLASVLVDALSVTATRNSKFCYNTNACDLHQLYVTPALAGVLFLLTTPLSAFLVWYFIHIRKHHDKREVDTTSYEHLLRYKDSKH